MQTQLAKLIEEMQRHAKVCESVAEDMTQESLTGASCDKEKNVQAAKEWMMKSQVWLEAEALVRELVEPTAPIEREPARPLPDTRLESDQSRHGRPARTSVDADLEKHFVLSGHVGLGRLAGGEVKSGGLSLNAGTVSDLALRWRDWLAHARDGFGEGFSNSRG